MPDHNDEQLVARARQDPQAFAALYDRYVDRIYAYVYRQMRDNAAAQDVTAVTFEKALRHIGRYEWRGQSFLAWLYRIARNETMSYYRRRKFLAPWTALPFWRPEGEASRAPETAVLHNEQAHHLHAALQQLSHKDQEVITLRFFEELDGDEVAAVLDCSTNAVYIRLHRALKRLRQKMEQMERTKEVNYVAQS